MRILTLAAVAALGFVAACTDRDDYAANAAADQAATTEYGADAAADAARAASASAAAAADAARDAANVQTRTVIVPDPGDDRVTVQVGPDGVRANATVDTD